MNSYAYYNGQFGKREEISVPLSDRSIFFGDAIYDAAIGSYDRILWEEEHINRFLCNADRIGIKHSFTKNYLSQLLREIAVRSMLDSYFIYFQMSRSHPTRNHSAIGCNANLLVTVEPMEIRKEYEPLKLITVDDHRYEYCDIKTINLLPSVLSMTQAENQNCDEAVFVKNGIITECSKSNISIIKEGRLITHPKTNRILPGIARAHLLKQCSAIDVQVVEREFDISELLEADEVLISSTTKLCKKANSINGISIAGKNRYVADKLCDKMYDEYINFCKI